MLLSLLCGSFQECAICSCVPVLRPHPDGLSISMLSCRHGVIVYRKELPVGALIGGGILDFGQPVHDYAQASFSRYSFMSVRTAGLQCKASVLAATSRIR